MAKYTPAYLKALVDTHGSISAASRASGINRTVFQRRMEKTPHPSVSAAPLPPKKIDLEERLALKRRAFSMLQERKRAETWRPHTVKLDGPIGIIWFGDPHVDDDGCNFPLLERDIRIANKTEGLLAANLGDTINNWVGKLEREYARQTATIEEAIELYEWFAGAVDWWLWLYGNHCLWPTPNTNLIKHIAQNSAEATAEWQTRLKLVFPNGREAKIWAAHDFKGHSQWNPLHGPMKRAAFGAGEADLYIAGDKHNWALFQNEDEHSKRAYWAARARGYKFIDSYGENLGFGSQNHGAAIVSVIDPSIQGPGFMTCFADAEEGAEFLTFKRKKARL